MSKEHHLPRWWKKNSIIIVSLEGESDATRVLDMKGVRRVTHF